VGLIFLTAREWFGRRAAWCAAILAALTGLFTFYEALILQAAVDAFLTAASLWLLTLALRRGQALWCGLAGVVFGLQALNRPNVLVAAVAVLAGLAIARRFRPAVWLAAGVCLAMMPVGIRNAAVSHEWTLTSSQGGLNFYIGNAPEATGYYRTISGITPSIQ